MAECSSKRQREGTRDRGQRLMTETLLSVLSWTRAEVQAIVSFKNKQGRPYLKQARECWAAPRGRSGHKVGFCADSAYCHSPRGKRSVINGRGDSNAPIPCCVLRFPRHIMRQIQNIQKLTCLVPQMGCSGSSARASPHLCAESAALPQENGGQCGGGWRGGKVAIKALSLICFARL